MVTFQKDILGAYYLSKEINVKITAIHNADCLIDNAISHPWVNQLLLHNATNLRTLISLLTLIEEIL